MKRNAQHWVINFPHPVPKANSKPAKSWRTECVPVYVSLVLQFCVRPSVPLGLLVPSKFSAEIKSCAAWARARSSTDPPTHKYTHWTHSHSVDTFSLNPDILTQYRHILTQYRHTENVLTENVSELTVSILQTHSHSVHTLTQYTHSHSNRDYVHAQTVLMACLNHADIITEPCINTSSWTNYHAWLIVFWVLELLQCAKQRQKSGGTM